MDSQIKIKAGLIDRLKDVSEILNIVPSEVIEQFAVSTNVDRHVKLLQGGLMFNMLLHMLLTENRISQRVAREVLTGKMYEFPVQPKSNRVIADHTSITKRLASIKVEFFRDLYEKFRDTISSLYQPVELRKLHLSPVDSTIVAETCNKLSEGFLHGARGKDGRQRRHVKYSEVFDGLSVLGVCFNDDPSRQAENNALPGVIRKAARYDRLHRNLYIIDRGLTGSKTLGRLSCQDGGTQNGELRDKVNFLVRISDSRRTETVGKLECDTREYAVDSTHRIVISEFDEVRIFSSASAVPDPGIYRHVKATLYEDTVDAAGNVVNTTQSIINLLTDVDDITATEMLEAYRKRWMIEVFFKFIKQNLDFSHLLSTSANGLQVMMYMTMIAAMMVLIYGKACGLGFRTAKVRFDYKVEAMTVAQMILISGGNPAEFMRKYDVLLPKWASDATCIQPYEGLSAITDCEYVFNTIKHV